MDNTARSLALDVLIKVLNNQGYSNISLNKVLQDHKLSVKDKNFVTQLVYGTIQYQLFLEYQLKDLIKTKLKDKFLKPLLLMSIYQLVFLDRVPNNAVLDEANKLAKSFGGNHNGSFKLVNGVLRNFLRQGVSLPAKNQKIEYLSVKYSMPIWIVNYLIDNFSLKRAKSILQSLNLPAKNSVRMCVDKNNEGILINQLNKAGYDPERSTIAPSNLILSHGGISQTNFFKDGKVTIQDEAASLVVASFDFIGNELCLDACSAPGGKTAQIAENLSTGKVLATDLHKNKLKLVMQNAERLHVENKVKTKQMDAKKADEILKGQLFDKILVDAPCSGLGLLRRKPEIRYTKTMSDINNLAKIQIDILNSVCQVLKPKGELVYSTCTITKEEDEEVIAQFLKMHPEFEIIPIELQNIQSKSTIKILPDTYGSDGFFIAKLRLRG